MKSVGADLGNDTTTRAEVAVRSGEQECVDSGNQLNSSAKREGRSASEEGDENVAESRLAVAAPSEGRNVDTGAV